jgi:hypothetical protein
MLKRLCLIGLDEPEYRQIAEAIDAPVLAHESVPRVIVDGDRLFVEARSGATMLSVSHVVFHGIFENDLDLIAGLALWGGPCLPNAVGMMDCRLRLPCLIRARRASRFGSLSRGYLSPGATFYTESQHVAKWGNWHCGENKACFNDKWTSDEACLLEPFLQGESVRLVMIGEQAWQIRLAGRDWLKSIHDPQAEFMEIDPELLDDTRAVKQSLGLEIAANDYLVADDGSKHLLELNHIPNVTRFPEIWSAYRDYVVRWATGAG